MSVVIPAHDEGALIATMLSRIVEGDPAGQLEIVVVANGCSDATAVLAASVSPRIRVVEIEPSSKISALNAGDAEAISFPRAYVDADVEVTAGTLLALADSLDSADGPMVASPRFVVDARQSNWFTRQYFRAWSLSDYRTKAHIGSGIYAMSKRGRDRFDRFPEVIADDRFAQLLFAPGERLTLDDHEFVVKAPKTLGAQIARSTRIQVGNLQLVENRRDSETDAASHSVLVRRAAAHPTLWPALVIYSFGYLLARSRARKIIATGAAAAWNRDESSRR